MSTSTDTNARLRTQYSEVTVICPSCRAQWSPSVVTIVNIGTDPQGREGILRGSIHRPACPRCKRIMELDHIFSVYDPERQLVVQVRPKWEFNAGGGEEVYWKRLEDLVLKHAEDEVVVDVVFGYADLIDKYLGGQAAVEAARARANAERAAGHKPGTLLGNDANTNADPDDGEGNTIA
jgi:hypothetical protein